MKSAAKRLWPSHHQWLWRAVWEQKGSPIDGDEVVDLYGHSIESISLSADGRVVAVGSLSPNGVRHGQVRVFSWAATDWSQKGDILTGKKAYNSFGESVDLSDDGNTLAVANQLGAAHFDENRVQVFEWNHAGAGWDERGDLDSVGSVVALSGDGDFVATGATHPLAQSFVVSVHTTCDGDVTAWNKR